MLVFDGKDERQWCDQQIIEEIDDTIWWIHDGKISLKKQIIFYWNNLFLLQNNPRHYLFSRHVLTTITIMKNCWFIKHLWMIQQVRIGDKIFSVRIICNPSNCHLFDTLFCFSKFKTFGLSHLVRKRFNLPYLFLSLGRYKEILQYNLKVTKRCAKYGSSLRYVVRQILECKIAWQNICRESLYFCFPLLLRLKSTISRNVGIG